MRLHKTFDERVRLYSIFGQQVAALRSGAWQHIIARSAKLDGSSLLALVERARLTATPYEYVGDFMTAWAPLPLRILATASRITQTSLAFAYEASQEFEALVDDAPKPRRGSTGSVRNDLYYDGYYDIECALLLHQRDHAGVRASVRAAGQAVLYHDMLSEQHFRQCYAAVAPEIPFAALTYQSRVTA